MMHGHFFAVTLQTDDTDRKLTQGFPRFCSWSSFINIYLNDLFYLSECTEVCSFADDTTFYTCDKDLSSLINRLEHENHLTIEWFENNHIIILNQEKCHLLVSGHKHENMSAIIGQTKIWENRKQILLGVEIDSSLNFDLYVHEDGRKREKSCLY